MAVAAVLPGAQASIALLLLALVIDLVKRRDAEGTWQASHFSWRIRSVLWAGVLYIVTSLALAAFLVPGWIAWGLISLWFLYRIVKGMVRMSAGRADGAHPWRLNAQRSRLHLLQDRRREKSLRGRFYEDDELYRIPRHRPVGAGAFHDRAEATYPVDGSGDTR